MKHKLIMESWRKFLNKEDPLAGAAQGGDRGEPGATSYTGESIFRGEGDVKEFFTSDVYRTDVTRAIDSALAGEGEIPADVAIESIRQLHDYAVRAQDQNPPDEPEFMHSYISALLDHKDWLAAAGIDDNPYSNKALRKYGDSPLKPPWGDTFER